MQIVARQLHRILVEGLRDEAVLEVALDGFGQRIDELVERLAQFVHQPLDLGIGRVVGERLLQFLLQLAQALFDQRHLAFLDTQRRAPEQLDDFRQGLRVVLAQHQAAAGGDEPERHDHVFVVHFRPR